MCTVALFVSMFQERDTFINVTMVICIAQLVMKNWKGRNVLFAESNWERQGIWQQNKQLKSMYLPIFFKPLIRYFWFVLITILSICNTYLFLDCPSSAPLKNAVLNYWKLKLMPMRKNANSDWYNVFFLIIVQKKCH